MAHVTALLGCALPQRACIAPLLLAAMGVAGAAPSAAGQAATTLSGATILTGNGGTIENGTLVVRAGRIAELGRNVAASDGAATIVLNGKFVTPGLIDAWCTLGMRLGATGDVLGRASDAFDRYAEDDIRAALAQGVTAVYVPARAGDGIGGLGAVLRLRPGAGLDEIIVNGEAAVCATLGSDPAQGSLARVRSSRDLRKRFADARDFREAKEKYAEDLKEYEKKLAERAAKGDDKAAEKPAGDGERGRPPGGERPEGPSRGERRRGLPGQSDADDDETTVGDEDARSLDEAQDAGTPDDTQQPRPPRPGGRGGRGDGAPEPRGGDAQQTGQRRDELQKPPEPPRDPRGELLLRVLDGELPLRAEAHRPEDILNAVAVAKEFNIRLIIEGGSGAHLIADRLAEAKIPVVLGEPPGSMRFDAGPRRFDVATAAAILTKARVRVYFGSGPGGATRHLALQAAARIGSGLDPEAALQAITSGAAKLLGVEKKLGTLASGMPADFVVWSDHPFSPAARVEQVFIGGVEVYKAEP